MTLRNAFGDIALDATLQNTNTAIADVETAVTALDTSIDATTTAVTGVQGAVTTGASDIVDAIDLMSEQVILLRKLLKIMESQATIDSSQRQRIALDAVTSNLTLSNVTTVGTVSSVSSLPTLSTVTTLNQFAGVDLRWQWMENARIAYNTGIRSKLTY